MIGIDLTYFASYRHNQGEVQQGVEIFLGELLDGFVELGLQSHFCLIVNYDCAEFIKKRFPDYQRHVVRWLPGELVWKLSRETKNLERYRKSNQKKRFLRAVEKKDFACIWYPFTTPAAAIWERNSFCTIHDIIPYHETSDVEKRESWRRLAEQCGKIVTISNFVKEDIVNTLKVEKEIPVIPNSIQMNMSKISDMPVHDGEYMLCVNAYAPHKNTITLLKAFSRIVDRTDMDLVFCGGRKNDEYWKMLEQFIQEHGLEKRVRMLFRIPTEEKNWLLKNASLFVTPSMNEGFGRTPVEAAICGVPVISTKAASLYEATRGLVHYYDEPEDDALLAEKLMECIKNPDSPEKLEEISRELSEVYSIESCAAAYWEILKQYE